MYNNKRKFLFVIITLLCCSINAHDFESNGIYYNILSDSTVSVTFRGNKYDSYSNEYYGEIVIPDSIIYKGNTYYIDLIGQDAFYGCSAINSIKLPEHLTRIGARAFMWCNNLLSINIPSNVVFVGDEAFQNCKKIKKIQLPDKLAKINNSVFWGCEQLSSVIIGSECTEIGRNAFYSCDKLVNIVIPDNVSYIGASAFQDSSVDSVSIGSGMKSIASEAFSNCSIKKIVCKAATPPSISGAFSNFNATVEVPAESLEIYQNDYYWGQFYIKAIGMPDEERNFSVQGVHYTVTVSQEEVVVSGNDSNNDNVIVPSHVVNGGTTYKITRIKKIGANVKSITISGDVKYIEDDAFTGCKNIQSLILEDGGTPLSIGRRSGSYNGNDYENALFYDCKLNNIYIGRNLEYSTNYYYEQYSPFFSNPIYEKTITIGDSVTQIKDYMFKNISLKSVNIPKHVQLIGKRAFADNGNLDGIILDIPASCVHIGLEAFSGCASGIDSINVSPDNPYYDSRENCNALIETRSNTLILGCKKSDIPNTVTSIGEGAFRSKYNFFELKYISIPENVTSIGNSAFENCTGLKSIVIPGNVSTIGMDAFLGCKSLHKVTFMGEYINMFNNISTNIDTLLIPNSKVVGVYSGFTSLKKLDIGGAEEIPSGALAGLTELTDLTIPFVGCGSKATATGENGVIGAMFYNEYNSKMRQITQYYNDKKSRKSYVPVNLEKLTITDECNELGYGALYGMSTLKEITLPSSLYMVGEKALYGCAGLEHIYCKGASPAACFDNSFYGVRTATCVLHIPYQADGLYARSTGWKEFYNIQTEQPLKISVTHNIQNAGIVMGNMEYGLNSTASLTAIANSGYKFVAWIENGEVVCDTPTYEFLIEKNRSLLVVFTPIMNENNVQVSSSPNQVYFTWDIEEGVTMYTLTIYADAEMTDIVNTLQFDVHGNHTRTASNEQAKCLVKGLPSDTNYYYSLLGYTQKGIVVSQLTGSFKTAQDDVSIDAINVKPVEVSFNSTSQQIVAKGVRTGDSVYMHSADGTIVHKQISTDTIVMIDACRLPKGLYVIRIGDYIKKILIEPH